MATWNLLAMMLLYVGVFDEARFVLLQFAICWLTCSRYSIMSFYFPQSRNKR